MPNDESTLYKQMPLTAELPRGYKQCVPFAPDLLAKIAHLSQEEQHVIKSELADEIMAMSPMNTGDRLSEEERRELIEVESFAQELIAEEAAKKAAEDSKRG